MRKTLKERVEGFFTGKITRDSIVLNPFQESGMPLLKESRYFHPETGKQFGSGYFRATKKDIEKYKFDNDDNKEWLN